MSLQIHKQFLLNSTRVLLTALFMIPSIMAVAGSLDHVEFSTNLQKDGLLAEQRNVPLLLMVSAEECPYCMVMESDYLVPLLRNREYDSLVLIRKIHLDGFDNIIDFSGKGVAPTDLSQEYGVWVTPTLLFLNSRGEEVQKRMIGLGVRDFVSAYIDESILTATDTMKQFLP